MVVRELITKLGFKVDDKPLKKAEASIKNFRRGVIYAATAIAAAGTATFGLIKMAANFGDHLAKTSQKVGLTVEALQRLEYAAGLADLEAEELAQSMALLSRRVEDARDGSKEAAGVFQKLKLDPKQFKDNESLLLAIADRIKEIPDGAKKTALAMDLFGRSGAKMIPFLNGGSEEINHLARELEGLGIILNTEQAKASEKFNDDLTRMGIIIKGLGISIGVRLMPVVQNVINSVLDWYKANKELVGQGLEAFVMLLGLALRGVLTVVTLVAKGFNYVAKALGGAGRAALWIGWMVAGLAAIVAFVAGAIPTAIAIAAIAIGAAFGLIYDDIVGYMNGAQSVTGRVIAFIQEGFERLKKVLMLVWEFSPLKIYWDWLNRIYEFISTISDKIANSAFGKAIKGAVGFVVDNLPSPRPLANAQENASALINTSPSIVAASTAPVAQQTNNKFNVQQKVEIKIEGDADPEKVGNAVKQNLDKWWGGVLGDAAYNTP